VFAVIRTNDSSTLSTTDAREGRGSPSTANGSVALTGCDTVIAINALIISARDISFITFKFLTLS